MKWVFTDCKCSHLEVPSIQRVEGFGKSRLIIAFTKSESLSRVYYSVTVTPRGMQCPGLLLS